MTLVPLIPHNRLASLLVNCSSPTRPAGALSLAFQKEIDCLQNDDAASSFNLETFQVSKMLPRVL